MIKNENKPKSGNNNFVIKTTMAVIAVVVLISVAVWISMYKTSPDKTDDPANFEINIIHPSGGEVSTESEYIEYEAPTNAF